VAAREALAALGEEALAAVAPEEDGNMKKTMKNDAFEHGEAVLQCTRCHIRMKKLKNKDTIIDICENCGGLWLDRDEIDKLAALHPRNTH
jgi:hypothetical protein